MTISASDVVRIAPELATETVSRINSFIADAALFVDSTMFGVMRDMAHANLTAHFMTLANRGGSGGQVTSEQVGDLSRSYSQSNSTSNSDSLSQTAYGAQYLLARESRVMTPMVIL